MGTQRDLDLHCFDDNKGAGYWSDHPLYVVDRADEGRGRLRSSGRVAGMARTAAETQKKDEATMKATKAMKVPTTLGSGVCRLNVYGRLCRRPR